MHAVVEYLGVALMIILIIITSTYVSSQILQNVVHVKEEQLLTVAERIIDKILLTPGHPVDWGYNFTKYNGQLTDFGLLLYGTRTPYDLDPDKVLRLANSTSLPNPLYINSTQIAEMLGIAGKYYFILEMKPLLIVNMSVLDYYETKPGNQTIELASKVEVSIRNWYGIPVMGANVTGMYLLIKIYRDVHGDAFNYTIFIKNNVTMPDGKCILDYTQELKEYFNNVKGSGNVYTSVILFHVNWHGFVAVKCFQGVPVDVPVLGYIIGNYVILESNVTLIPRGAIHVRDEVIQAVPEFSSLLTVVAIEIVNASHPAYLIINKKHNYRVYELEYVEKLSSHVILVGWWRNQPVTVIIDRIPVIRVEYGTVPERGAPPNSVKVVRIAHLFNYPYVVELTLWRRAEG